MIVMLSNLRGAVAQCSVDGCERPYSAKGMCKIHYMRDYKRKRFNRTPRSLWSTTVGAQAVHVRCRALWGPAANHPCVECGGPAKEWAYDGTDPTDIYAPQTYKETTVWKVFSRFPEFYMPMCCPCHRAKDKGEVARLLHQYRLAKYGLDMPRAVESA